MFEMCSGADSKIELGTQHHKTVVKEPLKGKSHKFPIPDAGCICYDIALCDIWYKYCISFK